MKNAFGLPDKYWDSLSEKNKALYAVIRPMPTAPYTVDWSLSDLESALSRTEEEVVRMGGTFELNPDFQRGHVWNDAQRIAFVEALFRGNVTGRILFNCPGWIGEKEDGDIPANTFQCIDGLQRLTAVRKYLAGDIRIFGGMTAEDLRGTPFAHKKSEFRLQVGIYEFWHRKDLLNFYLDLNSGGTVHSPDELNRVRAMLEDTTSHIDTPDCPGDK